MAGILRQVRFGGIDIEEEVGDFWNRNRQRRFSIPGLSSDPDQIVSTDPARHHRSRASEGLI